MSRTIKTLQRSKPVVAVRVAEENIEVPMAESVTLRKHQVEHRIGAPTSDALSKALFEIGIKQVEFSQFKTTGYLQAKVIETIEDHPALLPYAAGDVITAVGDMPFTTEGHFVSLINEGIEQKSGSIWVVIQRGDAAPIRRTVTLCSSYEASKIDERFSRACMLLGFEGATFSERFMECTRPSICIPRVAKTSPFFEPIRSMIALMSDLPVYITEVNSVPVRKETLADQIETSRGRIGRMMSITVMTRASEKRVMEGCLNDVPANVEPGNLQPEAAEKTIFVPSSDIIMKVEQRLKDLDTKIAFAKTDLSEHTEASLRLVKELREARDMALSCDKQVGELEGQRKEFLKKLAAFAK
jgi:hypothetical protein